MVKRPVMPNLKLAIIVVTAALAESLHLLPDTPKVLPALKANQPHHSMYRPMIALVGLPIGGGASSSHLPNLIII